MYIKQKIYIDKKKKNSICYKTLWTNANSDSNIKYKLAVLLSALTRFWRINLYTVFKLWKQNSFEVTYLNLVTKIYVQIIKYKASLLFYVFMFIFTNNNKLKTHNH